MPPLASIAFNVGSAIPDSEGFEHNDLGGNYGGNTGVASIQSNTVTEGSYALEADSLTRSDNLIVRSTEDKWPRNDVEISYSYRHNSSGTAYGVGIAFACQSTDGHASNSGYYVNDVNNNGQLQIKRLDNGSGTNLQTTSHQTGTDQWIDAVVRLFDDDTIEFEVGGTTLSAQDSTYSDGYLGVFMYDPSFVDNIQFEGI